MSSDSPVLVVDFCSVADKYDFLESLAVDLAPRQVLIADAFRGRRTGLHVEGGGVLNFATPPRSVFHRQRITEFFKRLRPPLGMDEPRFAILVEHLRRLLLEKHDDVTPAQAGRNLVAAHRFTSNLLKRLRPGLTILWNQFHPLSVAAEAAVRAHGCPIAYIEYGLLPGTLAFDFLGQMGESIVARDAEAFDALEIDDEDRRTAIEAIRRLRYSRANRRYQPRLGREGDRLRARAAGRPIVLFAGHNDHAGGIVPYDDCARDFHSPLFESSAAAAECLGELARRHGWFVVYKPHPFAIRSQAIPETDDLATIGKADINDCIELADCVVTILSQTSYISLIHEKPLVMLGYNQLRGHNCHYQVEKLEDIGPTIDTALANKFAFTQREAWIDHVARLLRYYLYAYRGLPPVLESACSSASLARKIEAAIEEGRFAEF